MATLSRSGWGLVIGWSRVVKRQAGSLVELVQPGLNRCGGGSGWFQMGVFIVIVMLLGACSSQPQVEIPEEIAAIENLVILSLDERHERSIELEEEAMFGDGEEVFMRWVGFVTVDDRGRVYLTDPSQQKIHVFGPDERLIRSVGGQGQGPGEFRNITSIHTGAGYLHVYDPSQRMMSLFDLEELTFEKRLDLSLIEGSEEESPGRPVLFHLQEEGDYWVHFYPFTSDIEAYQEMRYIKTSVYDRSEERYRAHGVLRYERSEMIMQRIGQGISMMSAPYHRHPLLTTLDGYLVHGWSNELLFRFYDSAGRVHKAFYHPYDRLPLRRADVRTIVDGYPEQQRDMILGDDNMPDDWPVFRYLVGDDEGRLWIGTIGENIEMYNWWVINREGERIAQFEWPQNREIRAVRGGKVYARVTEEPGESYIMRYGIEMQE